jgi:hypothetical protein
METLFKDCPSLHNPPRRITAAGSAGNIQMIFIRKPELALHEDFAELSARIEGSEQKTLWFRVPRAYAEHLVTERSDAFLTGVLMYAMAANHDIRVEGPVSEKLLYSLHNYYMHLLHILNPQFSPVSIDADVDAGTSFRSGTATLMGFSGGVDSFAAFYDHHAKPDAKNYRLTHLVFNEVHRPRNHSAVRQQGQKIARFAEEVGLPIVDIEANLHEFSPATFVFSYIIRNVSAILTLQKLARRFLIASSYKYEDVSVESTYSMGFSESVTAPLLATENLDVILSGAQHSRVEKTMLLSRMPEAQRYLDVCAAPDRPDPYKSCSMCSKCLRTQLTLEILGELDRYSQVFDPLVYRQHRTGYVSRVLRQVDEYDQEVFKLAQDRRFKFSIYERARSSPLIHEVGSRVKRVLPRP